MDIIAYSSPDNLKDWGGIEYVCEEQAATMLTFSPVRLCTPSLTLPNVPLPIVLLSTYWPTFVLLLAADPPAACGELPWFPDAAGAALPPGAPPLSSLPPVLEADLGFSAFFEEPK